MILKSCVRPAPTALSGHGYATSTANSIKSGTVAYSKDIPPVTDMYTCSVK